MSDLQIPYEFTKTINGGDWFMLAKVMGWLKGIEGSVQIHPYKRRCSPCNIIKYKEDTEKGKARIYVNRDGLREVVERTPSILLDYKRLLGVAAGITRSEHVFGCLLAGFFKEMGVEVERQVSVGEYNIDFVVGGIVAVEYDETDHSSYDSKKEIIRSRAIQEKYRLIRISDKDNEGSAIAKVLELLRC